MNPTRAKVVAVLMACMLAQQVFVEAQEKFLETSKDGAEDRRLTVAMTQRGFASFVKAGAATMTAPQTVVLKIDVTAQASGSVPLLVTIPAGFTLGSASDCKGAYTPGGGETALTGACTIVGGKAKFAAQQLTVGDAWVVPLKMTTVPMTQPATGDFVVEYDTQKATFSLASLTLIAAVKGGVGAKAAGGDAISALMRPVNHTAKIENNIKFIFQLSTLLNTVNDNIIITLPVNYTFAKSECATVSVSTCNQSGSCTAKDNTTDFKCSLDKSKRAFQINALKTSSLVPSTMMVSLNVTAPPAKQASAGQATIITCRGGCSPGSMNTHPNYVSEAKAQDYGMTKNDVRVNSAKSFSAAAALVAVVVALVR
eukprot:Filipodium_phascolosomae@DN2679_c0_g1_i10.p1